MTGQQRLLSSRRGRCRARGRTAPREGGRSRPCWSAASSFWCLRRSWSRGTWPSASSRRLRKPPPSAGSPTGTRWWRCSAGRLACRSRTRRSFRPISSGSRKNSANSSSATFSTQHRSRPSFAASTSPRSSPTGSPTKRSTRACALRRQAAAGRGGRRREFRPARAFSRSRSIRPPAGARSRAARRRHAALVRARRPPSLAARRPSGCDPQVDQRAGDAGGHSRKNPRRAADHPALLSRRCLCDEEGRRIRHGVLRGCAHRSRASVPRRVRPADPVVRRQARNRTALRQRGSTS